VYVLAEADADRAREALAQGPVKARLEANAARPTGADDKARPYVFISRPTSPGSSIAHIDPLARPDQLMEPTPGAYPAHDLSLTAAMLADMGWSVGCGDGKVAATESCDQGPLNSDTQPDSCRSDCTAARCGDGIKDSAEACDLGMSNSDAAPDTCRKDCRAAHCGDNVLDKGERCDDGVKNSDSEPNACRMNCQPAHCGDGALDAQERCDNGAKNSDREPDACRKDCTPARCGDGVQDSAEECDQGAKNNDREPNACRKDCRLARCGDGIVDQDEACDDGPNNSDERPDACRTSCTKPRCGDGVVDRGEACEPGDNCSDNCQPPSALTVSDAGPGTQPEDNKTETKQGGCGCHIVSAQPSGNALAWLAAIGGVLAWRRRKLRARRRQQKSTNTSHF
jgi:MYXO-CTERM domain-containing protein